MKKIVVVGGMELGYIRECAAVYIWGRLGGRCYERRAGSILLNSSRTRSQQSARKHIIVGGHDRKPELFLKKNRNGRLFQEEDVD